MGKRGCEDEAIFTPRLLSQTRAIVEAHALERTEGRLRGLQAHGSSSESITMVTRSQLESLSQRIDAVAKSLNEGLPEYDANLNFGQNDGEFLAAVAERDPEAIWHPWVRLNCNESSRESERQFAGALKRARAAQIAAGKVPQSVKESSFS